MNPNHYSNKYDSNQYQNHYNGSYDNAESSPNIARITGLIMLTIIIIGFLGIVIDESISNKTVPNQTVKEKSVK